MSTGIMLKFVTCQSLRKLNTDSTSVPLKWDPEVNILTGIPNDSDAHNPWDTPREGTMLLL